MHIIIWESQFKKDYKSIKKRNKSLDKLSEVIVKLQNGEPLPTKNKNHKLKGKYKNCWECHIEPDWLLIYQVTSTELILVRTGSHSDLF